jgi:hypothetical protein
MKSKKVNNYPKDTGIGKFSWDDSRLKKKKKGGELFVK